MLEAKIPCVSAVWKNEHPNSPFPFAVLHIKKVEVAIYLLVEICQIIKTWPANNHITSQTK